MLTRWSSRLALAALVSLWAACAGGADSSEDDFPDNEGGAAGDSSTGGVAGSAGGGGAGASGTAGSAGVGGAGASGKGGAAGTGFPTGGMSSGSSGSGGAAGTAGGAAGTGFPVGGSAGAPAKGETGAPCTSSAECNSKKCVEVGNAKSPSQVCTEPCGPNDPCPTGMHCGTLELDGAVCIPDRGSLCAACAADTDCLNKGDRCLTATNKVPYCAQDCSGDGKCPGGYECKAPAGGPAGVKVCSLVVPATCPCAPNRDKAEQPCTKQVGQLTCGGVEVCNGALGKFEGCTAGEPAAETCNGLDDDCDGKVDELPNGSCSCSGGTCSVVCTPGFSRYPTDLPESAGCPCVADSGEPDKGSTCATALGLSSITDVGTKTSIEIGGTISADDDVDWYKIRIDDTAEANTNSYHARVSFKDNPGDEFAFTVQRGDCAQPTTPTLTSYDVCVNYQVNAGTATVRGQSTCAVSPPQANVPNCQDMGAQYFIAVQRKAGSAVKTCSKYVLRIEGGAGVCDQASFDALGDQFGPKGP